MTEVDLWLFGMEVGSGSEMQWITKFGRDGRAYDLDCAAGSIEVYICQNSPNRML